MSSGLQAREKAQKRQSLICQAESKRLKHPCKCATTDPITAPHDLGIKSAGRVTKSTHGIKKTEALEISDTEVYSEPHTLGFNVDATPEPYTPESGKSGIKKVEQLDQEADKDYQESLKRKVPEMTKENIELLERFTSKQLFSNDVNVSGIFGEEYALMLNSGIMYQARHDGIDYVLANPKEPAKIVAPLNLEVVSVSGSTIVLGVVGKPEINIGLAHLNPEELKNFKQGDIIPTGSVIASFPDQPYGNNTTGTKGHVHVTMIKQDENDPAAWNVVNPDTGAQPEKDLMYRKQDIPFYEYSEYSVEKTFEPAFYMDSEYEDQEYQPGNTTTVTYGEEHLTGYDWGPWKKYRWR